MALTLQPLNAEQLANWDTLTAEFAQRQVFHRQAWFNCLIESQDAEWKYWAVLDAGRIVGYFAGGVVRRGPFSIFGSPLRTWHTSNMGPLLAEGVDGREFVRALDEMARQEGLAMVEIEYPTMPHASYEEAGFSVHQTWTHQLPLTPDFSAMLHRMSNGRKHGIRKSQRSGLEVVECPQAAELVYDQLSRALAAKGARIPFSSVFPQAIVRNLKPLGRVFTLGVRNAEGQIVAAGIFPWDNGTVYLWDCSSEIEGRDLHPNDLLHWGLMQKAAEQGLTLYDMSGYGRFNKAFGAQLVATHRWNKCYSVAARSARSIYEELLKWERRSSAVARLLRPVFR
ncbi:MAG TPA: GNAT family N-acetyltransferase [Terriglobales bacterium]